MERIPPSVSSSPNSPFVFATRKTAVHKTSSKWRRFSGSRAPSANSQSSPTSTIFSAPCGSEPDVRVSYHSYQNRDWVITEESPRIAPRHDRRQRRRRRVYSATALPITRSNPSPRSSVAITRPERSSRKTAGIDLMANFRANSFFQPRLS